MDCLGKMALGALLLWASAVGSAIAAEPIRTDAKSNPPPKERLDAFDRYELRPLVVAGKRSNAKAEESIRRNLDKEIGDWVKRKNALPRRNDPARLLRIEPQLDGVRLVSGAGRFWLGPFLGSSRVLLRMRLIDAATGDVVAEPEFYQHASGMSGGFTLGVMDKAMLVRVTKLASAYLEANYSHQVGGASGDDDADVPSVPDSDAVSADAEPASTNAAVSGVNQWAYEQSPDDAVRSLAKSRNCNGTLSLTGNEGARSEYSVACWGTQRLKIDCEQGMCKIVP